MKKEQDQNNTTQPQNTSTVSDRLAQNPNPRANENICNRAEEPGTKRADIEDEVGSEITDGEDA